MGECGGGVWHWWMDLRLWAVSFAIIILIGVGIVVVNATAEQFNKFADGPFVVDHKEVVDVTRNYVLFEANIGTVYLLYNSEGQYASISEATYNYYSNGDLYPNTEPQIMIG
jgi:hypothetical protein